MPCAPINDFEQALADPQVKARSIETAIALHDGATFRTIASPLRFSETPLDYPPARPRWASTRAPCCTNAWA